MDGICAFCRRANVSEKVAGELITKEDLTIHKSCLYFSAGLAQKMDPSKGILGFTKEDIEKELKRGKRGKCVVCKKNGNFVGCAITHCPKAGHFPCLHADNYLFQYYGTFNSYCPAHCPSQSPCPLLCKNECLQCCVCFGSIKPESLPSFLVLYTPCCFHVIHRKCVQLQAWSAGEHFFRCPVCNDTNQFVEEMLRLGIEVPSRDASWETTGQFDDLHLLQEKCELEHCLCPKGRRSFTSSGPNKCMHCHFCGQILGHHECLMKVVAMETTGICEHRGSYVCEDCSPVLPRKQSTIKTKLMDIIDLNTDMSPSPPMQGTTMEVDAWEVVDLTTSSPEYCTDSAQLQSAPPSPWLKSDNCTVTFCMCEELVSKSMALTTSSGVVTRSESCRENIATAEQQFIVSISTSKLKLIPKTKKKERKSSLRQKRPRTWH